MIFKIGKDVSDTRKVTFSQVDFGKGRGEKVKFSVEDEISIFLEKFSDIYNSAIEEFVADDNLVGEFTPPYTGASSYPSVSEFMSLDANLRDEMIENLFLFDILSTVFERDRFVPKPTWLVHSVDSVIFSEDRLILSGVLIRY